MENDSGHIAATRAVQPEFDAVLMPHRSLGPRGFMIFMAGVSLVSFVAGIIFYTIGAWPVVGFFGLDLILIYGAFKLNYRAGRWRERISIVGSELVVRETAPSGKVRSARLDAYWVRVGIVPISQERVLLVLRSHGNSYVIGRFLNDDEKRSFADALSDALSCFRSGRPAPAISRTYNPGFL